MFSLVKRLNSRVSIFCRPHSLTMSSFAAKINEEISKYDVMIFSKSYCPYCIKAKDAIKKQNVSYGVLELDNISDGADIQNALQQKTGQRTVPNIFVKGKHLGGCDDTLAAIASGKFREMLNA